MYMKLKRLKTWTWLEVFIIPVVIHVKFSAAVHILHRNCVYQPQAVLMIWFLKDSFSVAQTSPQSILKYYMQNRILHRIYKNVKWSRYRHGVAQRVGRGIALLFHDRGTRRVWVVSSTPRPHFTPGKDPVPILQEAGWAPGPVWRGAENLVPTGVRSRTVQPVVGRYTDWANRPTPVHIRTVYFRYLQSMRWNREN